MFSGIVEEIGTIREVRLEGEPKRVVIECDQALQGANVGDSIAVNGVCLTVERFGGGSFTSGVMPETLRRTNLGELRAGERVNLERSLPATGRVGGHFVQGHVDAAAEVLDLRSDGAALVVKIAAPPQLARYIVEKGYITVDGASLTVMEVTSEWFTVSLVYHTQENITLSKKRPGDRVNLEVDIIAKYVERLVQVGASLPAPRQEVVPSGVELG
ncbi:MAG: riboflavin synthase [Chloroflexota bacterium]|nr:riboflavin synthase [Chloroflexota bacterium]